MGDQALKIFSKGTHSRFDMGPYEHLSSVLTSFRLDCYRQKIFVMNRHAYLPNIMLFLTDATFRHFCSSRTNLAWLSHYIPDLYYAI